MIRWYDYALAILAADMIIAFLAIGFTSAEWWKSALAGLAAGLIYNVWKQDYCQFRLRQENKR
jgi:hypothetical protein